MGYMGYGYYLLVLHIKAIKVFKDFYSAAHSEYYELINVVYSSMFDMFGYHMFLRIFV